MQRKQEKDKYAEQRGGKSAGKSAERNDSPSLKAFQICLREMYASYTTTW